MMWASLFKAVGGLLLLVLLVLLIQAARQPDQFRVERKLQIQASPEALFALIQDLRQFNRWNPYEKKDPQIQGQYSAQTAGPGARYAWQSKEVGEGSMEITAQEAPQRVQMRLDFLKPFEAHNLAEFQIVAQPGGVSEVSWSLSGPSPFISKLMGVIFNMDRMIGRDFEAGLQNLKALAEASPPAAAAAAQK